MMIKNIVLFSFFLTYSLFFSLLYSKETQIKEINLVGDILDPNNEISGMDWYKESLFLLPENINNYIFMIPRKRIQKYLLSKKNFPIHPKKISFSAPNYKNLIKGFEGFEAIAFFKNQVFILIETNFNNHMSSYLAWGIIDPNTYQIYIKDENLIKIDTPIQINNMAYESIIIKDKMAILLYEANGVNLQKNVHHRIFSLDNYSVSKIKGFNLEYRITDATKLDLHNKFWCINYFWPGENNKLKPENVFKIKDSQKIKVNKKLKTVEQLVECEVINDSIIRSKREPIQLKLENGTSRNWEGLVRYEKDSFLIVTDKYPRMILGFIQHN